MATLREEWNKVNVTGYTGEDTCPTCGQDLPAEQVDEARRKFNAAKADKLEKVVALGKQLKNEVVEIDKEIELLQADADKAQTGIAELEKALAKEQQKTRGAYEMVPDIARMEAKRQSLQDEIASLREGTQAARQEVVAKISALEADITTLEQLSAKAEESKRGLARIEELKQQEKKLAAEYERLMSELYLTEEFIRSKVRLLEDKINSRFKLARFKMFDVQVNGGVDECCETTVDGVPYGSGLNKGHQGLVGLDIINTLSAYYKFMPPVFYDNAEAIAQMPDMQQQLIALYVSAADKQLRVETKNEEE